MKDHNMVDSTLLSAAEQNTADSLRNLRDTLSNANRKKLRTLLKAISYRLLGTLATMMITFALTHEISLSLSIGALELFGKIVLFYLHERLWDKIF
jgi:uncharacterized membrane protein